LGKISIELIGIENSSTKDFSATLISFGIGMTVGKRLFKASY